MDEVKAGSLFEKVILPLRDDEYLDGDGFPRCKSCHTLRVYVSDDKTTPCEFMFQTIRRSARVACVSVRANRLKRKKSLKSCAVILRSFMTDKGFPLWVTGIRIAGCQRQL